MNCTKSEKEMATPSRPRGPSEPKNTSKGQRKSTIADVQKKETLFLKSREHSNALVELLQIVQSGDQSVTSAAITSLHKIFSRLFNTDAMTRSQTLPKETDKESVELSSSPEEQYKAWLQGRYHDCLRCLARVIDVFTDTHKLQELSLTTLLKLLELESNHPLSKHDLEKYVFPMNVFNHLIPKLLSKDLDMSKLIKRFSEYLIYDDIRYYFLMQARHHINTVAEEDCKQDLTTFCNNTFVILDQVIIPVTPEGINKFLCKSPEGCEDTKVTLIKEQRRQFGEAWLTFLSMKLPSALYKKTLVILHEAVMPHMNNPLLLTDFLTVSYNVGGAISLLALNGLYILITRHNMEYPDFYKKLYALFEPSIFHVKYKARFFHLADVFLSSTYLPAYLVAAFAKRLSRLSLTAPPSVLMLIIPFVGNLLLRHPSCQVMVHRPEGPSELANDPYVMDEPNPSKSHATDSSLWELQTLKSHYHPGVAFAAAIINKPFPKEEWNLSEYLELSTSEMIGWVANKKMKTAPVEFEPPKGLFVNDTLSKFWTFD